MLNFDACLQVSECFIFDMLEAMAEQEKQFDCIVSGSCVLDTNQVFGDLQQLDRAHALMADRLNCV